MGTRVESGRLREIFVTPRSSVLVVGKDQRDIAAIQISRTARVEGFQGLQIPPPQRGWIMKGLILGRDNNLKGANRKIENNRSDWTQTVVYFDETSRPESATHCHSWKCRPRVCTRSQFWVFTKHVLALAFLLPRQNDRELLSPATFATHYSVRPIRLVCFRRQMAG